MIVKRERVCESYVDITDRDLAIKYTSNPRRAQTRAAK